MIDTYEVEQHTEEPLEYELGFLGASVTAFAARTLVATAIATGGKIVAEKVWSSVFSGDNGEKIAPQKYIKENFKSIQLNTELLISNIVNESNFTDAQNLLESSLSFFEEGRRLKNINKMEASLNACMEAIQKLNDVDNVTWISAYYTAASQYIFLAQQSLIYDTERSIINEDIIITRIDEFLLYVNDDERREKIISEIKNQYTNVSHNETAGYYQFSIRMMKVGSEKKDVYLRSYDETQLSAAREKIVNTALNNAYTQLIQPDVIHRWEQIKINLDETQIVPDTNLNVSMQDTEDTLEYEVGFLGASVTAFAARTLVATAIATGGKAVAEKVWGSVFSGNNGKSIPPKTYIKQNFKSILQNTELLVSGVVNESNFRDAQNLLESSLSFFMEGRSLNNISKMEASLNACMEAIQKLNDVDNVTWISAYYTAASQYIFLAQQALIYDTERSIINEDIIITRIDEFLLYVNDDERREKIISEIKNQYTDVSCSYFMGVYCYFSILKMKVGDEYKNVQLNSIDASETEKTALKAVREKIVDTALNNAYAQLIQPDVIHRWEQIKTYLEELPQE